MNFLPRSRSELWQLLAVIAVPLAIPLVLPADPVERKVAFDQRRVDSLVKKQPDVVLIGNSMLNTRVNKSLFQDMVAPNTTGFVAEGGTRSTVWWFMMKNVVGALKTPPKVIFIFYRDYDFTSPGLHLEGNYLDVARSFMKPDDETLLAMAKNDSGPVQHPVLERYLPDKLTQDVRRRLGNLAVDAGAIGQGKQGDDNLQEDLTNLFDFQNLRSDVRDAGAVANDVVPDDERVFSTDPTDNFLELFNTFAKERGIRLIFYRVKRRPDAENHVAQDEDLLTYTKEFRHWAESNGHALVDETDDPRLTLSMYHDGDHLARAAMDDYTKMFVDRIQSLLPKPPAPATKAGAP
jgi:hypothetical protein